MALPQSAVSDLLEVLRTGEAVDLIAAWAAHVDARRAREATECGAVLGVHALLERGQGQAAIHEPCVYEIRPEADGQRMPDRALARSGRAIDRDCERMS